MKNSKVKIDILLPHIVFCSWKTREIDIKNFIKTFGYWAWEQSKSTLKVCINDKKILGEQQSSFIHLKEGETECIFFTPYDNKKYTIEYGRYIGNEIFIPFATSDAFIHLADQNYSIFPLPKHLLNSMKYIEAFKKSTI